MDKSVEEKFLLSLFITVSKILSLPAKNNKKQSQLKFQHKNDDLLCVYICNIQISVH